MDSSIRTVSAGLQNYLIDNEVIAEFKKEGAVWNAYRKSNGAYLGESTSAIGLKNSLDRQKLHKVALRQAKINNALTLVKTAVSTAVAASAINAVSKFQ